MIECNCFHFVMNILFFLIYFLLVKEKPGEYQFKYDGFNTNELNPLKVFFLVVHPIQPNIYKLNS